MTGGAGFIGSHLCDKLLSSKIEKLIIIDNFSSGKTRNIEHLQQNARVKSYKLNASNYQQMFSVFKKERIDIVFNLAIVPLHKSLVAPRETVARNILITTTMCELLRQKLYKTLIHCSSSEAYGTALYAPMDEEHPLNPITPYAASKAACDHIVMSYHRTFNVDVAIVRPFNAYGPRQSEGLYAAIVPITIRRILAGKQPIIYGDGFQTRDYTFVEDIVEGIIRVYKVRLTRGKVINIASGKEIRIRELVYLIGKLMDYKGKITYTKPRRGDVRRHEGDISLAKKLLHYLPKIDYKTGLLKTIEYEKRLIKERWKDEKT